MSDFDFEIERIVNAVLVDDFIPEFAERGMIWRPRELGGSRMLDRPFSMSAWMDMDAMEIGFAVEHEGFDPTIRTLCYRDNSDAVEAFARDALETLMRIQAANDYADMDSEDEETWLRAEACA